MDERNGATRGRTESTYPACAGDTLTSALRADLGQRARAAKPRDPRPDPADVRNPSREPIAVLRPRFALSPDSDARVPESDSLVSGGAARVSDVDALVVDALVRDGDALVRDASERSSEHGTADSEATADDAFAARAEQLARENEPRAGALARRVAIRSDEPQDPTDAGARGARAFELRSASLADLDESTTRTDARDRASSDVSTIPSTGALELREGTRLATEFRDLPSARVAASARASAGAHERSETARPTIGVVVPTLDEERLLPLLLDRLFDRVGDHDPLDRADEVVVADGESRDRTREIARERGATVVRACASRGVQLATGAHASSADVFLFLHADCVPRRGAIARIRRAFEDESVLATAMHQEIESAGLLYRCIERCADLRSRLGLVWGDSGLAVRRDAYEAVGGFGPFEIFEDVDLSLRLRRAGRIRFLSDATLGVSARRWHSEGALRCTLRNWDLSARFFLGADPNALARSYRRCAAV